MRIVIALILKDSHILINRRSDEAHMGGLWEFPGGKREAGESPEQAVIRECYEETGLQIKVIREWRRFNWDYKDRQLDLQFFQCQVVEDSLPTETKPFLRWVPLNELRKYQFPPANKEIIDELMRLVP